MAKKCEARGAAHQEGTTQVLPEFDATPLIGLNVLVKDAAVLVVEEDGEESIHVPQTEQLAAGAAMARCLMEAKLEGKEIKAIRHILGVTSKELANLMDDRTAVETITRWESGAQPMGGYAEKVLRLVVCEALKDRAPGISYDASMISNLRIIDPWRNDPEYCLPPLEFHRVKTRECTGKHKLVDAWNTEVKLAA